MDDPVQHQLGLLTNRIDKLDAKIDALVDEVKELRSSEESSSSDLHESEAFLRERIAKAEEKQLALIAQQGILLGKVEVKQNLQTVQGQLAVMRLAQTKSLPELDVTEQKEETVALRLRETMQVLRAVPLTAFDPHCFEGAHRGYMLHKQSPELLAMLKHWTAEASAGLSCVSVYESLQHLIGSALPFTTKNTFEGYMLVPTHWERNPALGAVLGVQTPTLLTAQMLLYAEILFYALGTSTHFPYVHVITDMKEGVAFYCTNSTPAGKGIVRQVLPDKDSIASFIRNVAASTPGNIGRQASDGSLVLPSRMDNPTRVRLQ